MRSTSTLCAVLTSMLVLLSSCGDGVDQEAVIRQRALERAGEDPAALCRLAHDHAGTPEGERAEGIVADQLAGWQGRLTEARASRRMNETFATWLEGLLTSQESSACTPLTVIARIHFERTEENAESSAQQSVERTVEAALETHDREVLAEAVAEALAPLTGSLVPSSAAVRVGEDEATGTIIELDCRLEGSDFLALSASTTVTLRQDGGTTTLIELPVVVLPQESVDPHRSRRTTDASNLTMAEILRRLRARIIDGLGLQVVEPALEPFEGSWSTRVAAGSGACPAEGVDLSGDSMRIDPGRRTITIGDRVFDAWVDDDELVAESHRIGGPCRSRVSEILRFEASPEGELVGGWSATFDGHEECERHCTRTARVIATRGDAQ